MDSLNKSPNDKVATIATTAGLAVLLASLFMVGVFSLAAVVFPKPTLGMLENVPVKVLIALFILMMAARLGWSIFLHFHVPTEGS